MLVLCNGMPRSASTWSYNVAVGLLRRSATGEVAGGYDENMHRFARAIAPSAAHVVLKCHSLDPTGLMLSQTGAAKVIYTWRDPADAVASFMTMFNVDFDHAFAVISASLDLCRRHSRGGKALILGYGEIVGEPLLSVAKVADHLGLELPEDAIAGTAEETSLPRMREKTAAIGSLDYGHRLIRHERTLYDPDTLLNLDHIRNGGSGYGSEALTPAQLRQIDELVRDKGLPP